jgi:hypothetical protein
MKELLGPAQVAVTVTIVSDNPAQFQLSSSELPIRQTSTGDPVLVFNNGQNGIQGDGFDVTFTIDDQTKKGYGFFQDQRNPKPDDAISVKVIDSSGHCPGKGAKWPGFDPTGVSTDRQTLTVNNGNKHLQYFGFAMHFSLAGETNPSLDYDPIGDNQDGLSFMIY